MKIDITYNKNKRVCLAEYKRYKVEFNNMNTTLQELIVMLERAIGASNKAANRKVK